MDEKLSQKNNNIKKAPEPTIRRLPIYIQYLKEKKKNGITHTSSSKIADDLCMVPIVVRKDIEVTGITGRPKVGYDIDELIYTIEDFLGWNNSHDAFLVGAGNLGLAILGYEGFLAYGLNIIAAFDIDNNKIGQVVHNKTILDVSKLPDMIKRMKIRIGIITVPAYCAQVAADTMVEAGIEAIWNFAPVYLNVPAHVIVQNENLASSLAILSKELSKTFLE